MVRRDPILVFCEFARLYLTQTTPLTICRDLKNMAKIVTGILIFRKSKCTDWTSDLDNQMNAWTQQYTNWLETAKIALEEAFSTKSVPKAYPSVNL